MPTINYNGKILTLDYEAQLDDCGGKLIFSAFARDEEGRRYTVRWDYVEPEWAESLTPEEKTSIKDLSDFADWEHPAEVKED